jgi:RHS repeat-associated protein
MVGGNIDHDFTSYDGFGRPLALTRTDQSGTTNSTWNYDLQGQIIYEATTGSNATYVYDKAGNRTRETLSGGVRYLHTYIPNTNRLEKRCAANTSWLCISGGTYDQYSYNENGDMTRKQTNTGLDIPYFRTAAGQITTLFATAVHYRYEGLGRMVMRRDGQSLNQITGYDGHNVAWHNGSFFLHGDGVDDPLVLSVATNCYYVTEGGRMLGYLTESGGDCSANWEQMGKFAGAIANSYGFALNRSRESYSELSFFRNRWYDSKTGRFTQEDPIGFAGGSNLYAYAGNNPASYTDPFGLCPEPGNKNGTVCVSLFISAPSALGLKGDARGFSSSSDPAQSRVWLHVDPAKKTFSAHANPSCTTGGRCAAALSSNQINVSFGANGGFTVSVNAKNSILPGPSINGTFSFQPNGRGGFTTSGNRDAFPSAEAYLWRNGQASTLFQRTETSVLSLFGFMRNDRW